MRRSEEARFPSGRFEARVLEDLVDLVRVGIDRAVAERRDEDGEVHGRLSHLDGIGARVGCLVCGEEPLLERDRSGGLVVTAAAGDKAHRGHCQEEWDREAHSRSILRRATVPDKP